MDFFVQLGLTNFWLGLTWVGDILISNRITIIIRKLNYN